VETKDGIDLLYITQTQFDALPKLCLDIGGRTFEFTREMQTWPQQLKWALTGESSPDKIYCTIASLRDPNLTVVGQTFLEHFYVLLETGNNRVGFADAKRG